MAAAVKAPQGESLTVRHAFTAAGKDYAPGEMFSSSDVRLVQRLVKARYLFEPLEAPNASN